MADNPLGQQSDYPEQYSPQSLCPLPRARQRELLGVRSGLPFSGADLWRAYELSWLDNCGRPRWSTAEIIVPCQSENLIESKSFKLYLNSLNMTRLESESVVVSTLEKDLSAAAAAEVTVRLFRQSLIEPVALMEGSRSLDDLLVDSSTPAMSVYQTDATLLRTDGSSQVEEALYSHVFRSLCPVTSQPDWGTVFIRYSGPSIDHSSLLEYIVSFRQHQGFHEDCVERMFCDIQRVCQPEWLVVGIQFLRRGGLEINPWRWTGNAPIDSAGQLLMRTDRQ